MRARGVLVDETGAPFVCAGPRVAAEPRLSQ